MFTKLQCCNKQTKLKKKVTIFGKYKIYLERLEDNTQSKHNCVKTFDVRHDAKRHRVSQRITGSWKMQYFSIMSFLNDSKLYDEERKELSLHPLYTPLLRVHVFVLIVV